MIASLLSEDSRWINGERIEVTGGYVSGLTQAAQARHTRGVYVPQLS